MLTVKRHLAAACCTTSFSSLQDTYTTPLTSIQCWHVHCEECWLRTLVKRKISVCYFQNNEPSREMTFLCIFFLFFSRVGCEEALPSVQHYHLTGRPEASVSVTVPRGLGGGGACFSSANQGWTCGQLACRRRTFLLLLLLRLPSPPSMVVFAPAEDGKHDL